MAPRTPVVISPVPVFPIVILSLILYLSGSSVLASMANVLTTTQQFGFIASTFSSRNFIESILFSGSAGTFLGSFFWGVFSDTFGRKRSLLISLFSSLVFILIRVFHRIDMAWLPFYTFCASICNGSLVIVKAYAGDILDATNATEGITALGVCTIFINAIFLGIDSILNKIAIYTRNMQWILVIPTLLETIALLCVIACVQLYFHETIRVKWKSDLQNNNDGIQTMQIASSTDAPSFKKDFLNTVNTQLISFYRKLSNTTDDEEDEDTDKKREAAKIVEMYGKKSNDSNSVSSSAASGEIWSTGNGVSATRDKVSSEELFAKEEDRYATVMLEGVSVYAPAVINNNTKYNSITLAEDQEYIRTNSSGSTNSDSSDDFFFGGVSTDTPPPPPPPRKVYSPTPNQIGVLKDGRSRAVRLRPNSMSRSSPPLSRRYSNSPIPEEKGNHVLTRSAMSVGPGTRYIPNSSNVSIVCPTSPIRRNVSFNGITTVKVIGNDSLAVGKLKLLNQNETPLNTGPGVFPNVSGSSAGTGLDSGSSNVSSQLITLQEEGESELEDRRSPTDSVVPDSAKSTTHRISPTPIKASNKESSCVILPQNVESETTGIVTLDTINDESTLNNDSESDPLLKEERDVPVETNASSPSDTDTESSVVTASSRSESENIAAAAQDLITTMSTSRYCNGANEYVTQLESISPMGVLLKTLKSLTSRNTVVYSVILYTINMCIITAVSICTPLWLLQHSESDQTSDSERKMETLVKYNVSNSSMLSSTISSMESIIEVLPEAEVIMETVVDAEGVGGMGNYYKQPTASPTAMVAASQWDPINNPSGMGMSGTQTISITSVSFMFAIILLVKLFTPAMKDCKVINCYRFGSGLMVASVLLVPSIFNVHEACKGASEIYSWLFVIILYTCINLGSLWSLLCTIVMINNSSYKWERGTVFGGAETVACIGKLFGILLAKYFYTAALHSSYMWPFDASMYWYALGIFLYMSGRLTYYLPKGILKKKREPKQARYALSIGGGVADEWYHNNNGNSRTNSNTSSIYGMNSSDSNASGENSSKSPSGALEIQTNPDDEIFNIDSMDTGDGSTTLNSLDTKHAKALLKDMNVTSTESLMKNER